jgi:drug/metabolite transporter (DMT)-like permease
VKQGGISKPGTPDLVRLRADLILLAVALIWGTAFVAQRVAAQRLDAFTFNGLRFLLAGSVILPFSRNWRKIDRRSLLLIIFVGCVLFVASFFQQIGLKTTSAGNAGFITSLYIVLVPLLLLIIWRKKVTWLTWLAALLAAAGAFLLSSTGRLQFAAGDGFELLGALFWAVHVIMVGRSMQKLDLFQFSAGQNLVAGFLSLIMSFSTGAPSLQAVSATWFPLLYTGILSIGVGYTLQAYAQRHAPASDAAIIMGTEAVFAALFGFIILGEILTLRQLCGCGLILAAMTMVQIKAYNGGTK